MSDMPYKDALSYHEMGRPGKIEVVPTKPYATQRDLSVASVRESLSLVLKYRQIRMMFINILQKVILWL